MTVWQKHISYIDTLIEIHEKVSFDVTIVCKIEKQLMKI